VFICSFFVINWNLVSTLFFSPTVNELSRRNINFFDNMPLLAFLLETIVMAVDTCVCVLYVSLRQ